MAAEKRKSKQLGVWWYFIGAAGVILLYALFAYPVYTALEVHTVRTAYEKIAEMDLNAMEDEEEDLLQGYQVDKLEFLIVNGEYEPVYVTKEWEAERQIRLYITEKLDRFQEKPVITVQKNRELRIIHLRGLLNQEGETYYVHIRKEMHAAGEVVMYSAIYFGAVLLLFLAVALVGRKRRRAEREMEEQQQTNLDRAEKEFVANVSHELKTPLAVISGQVEMLQNMGNEIDRDYYFASIREEIDKMSEMVGNLLDITIMEHRMEKMEMSRVNLSDMMDYLILKYDALFRKNGVKIQTEVAPGCVVVANHMYLEQAINNYIMNAFQHTAQGKRISIRLTVESQTACIAVYNEGSQITAAEKKNIWQSFYMNSKTGRRKQKIGNAGLGLYTVRKIVEQHHGECGAENKADGVEFWIRLPLEQNHK